jgi:hypothetical protein
VAKIAGIADIAVIARNQKSKDLGCYGIKNGRRIGVKIGTKYAKSTGIGSEQAEGHSNCQNRRKW